jgi:hypothetical protein
MVDDINFPKGLPPVPASGRVQRVNRKKREEQQHPFEKFLDEEDQEDKKKKKSKKESDKVDILGNIKKRRAQNFIESPDATDAAEALDDSAKKVIDVRA